MYNQQMYHFIQTREAFEGRLKTMSGLEFMVAETPTPEPVVAGGRLQSEATGVWAIRKQTRRKRPGFADEITIHNTYYVVGLNIYMAPSVGAVLRSRILSTVTNLTQFFQTASALPNFSPAYGYSYLQPSGRSLTATTASQSSRLSVEPDAVTKEVNQKVAIATAKGSQNAQDLRTLAEAFNLSQRHQDDYMDLTPLKGEPGKFISMASQQQRDSQASNNTKPVPPVKSTSTPVIEAQEKVEKAEVLGLNERKGSKGGAKSPTSPTMPPKPKRRKSKAAPQSATSTTAPQ